MVDNSKTVCRPATPTRRRQAFSVTSATQRCRALAPLSAPARLERIFLGRSKQASARNRTPYCPDSVVQLARATLTAASIQQRLHRLLRRLVLAKVRSKMGSSTHAEGTPQIIIFTRSSRVVLLRLPRMVIPARWDNRQTVVVSTACTNSLGRWPISMRAAVTSGPPRMVATRITTIFKRRHHSRSAA